MTTPQDQHQNIDCETVRYANANAPHSLLSTPTPTPYSPLPVPYSHSPPVTQRALLLINPYARRGEQTRLQVIEWLKAFDMEFIDVPIADPAKISDLIQTYRDRVDRVIIGGGDGTMNAAIAGLLATQLPLGVIPLGTANNLARTLKLPQSLEMACRAIVQGKTQLIDLGCVNGKYFLNVAGMGISADINQQVEDNVKRRWGVFAYAMTALRVISRYRRFTAEIRCNDQSVWVKTFQITVCNGRYYGSGLTVAADAAIDDERLDLCSLEVQHWWQAIALIPTLMRGEYATGQRIRVLQGQEIEIYTTKPRLIDTDGEVSSRTPAYFRVIPKAISVFVPD
ncbi:lipid kinase [Oscillatoria sp. FACHB-1407]|uniref:lipid kinase n=1 Tax=Oscillatoria sp. FACHB-1407 TaxID=2692847 RepID=UPI0021030D61|nr:lipid kinase [Oscillatoria sp. FACHB-1407]